MDEVFGQMVKRLRVARRWSQEELGARAGLDQATVSLVERGKGKHTVATVTGLAQAFGLDETGAERWLRHAGVLPPLPADAMPPARLVAPEVEDRAWDKGRLVAWVEQHPDEHFRRDLADDAETMSPEEYEEYCLIIARAWLANGQLAQRVARMMRGQRPRP